ncbi:MAG TPA: hypothetical protein VGJ95_11170 [Pseudonocardiaceae bacterium]
MFGSTAHTDPAVFSLRDLERNMVRSTRLAAACRLVENGEEAEMHTMWMDILLDEWARRMALRRNLVA